MATLFQISDDLRAVLDLVDESAELPPVVEQWFAEIGEAEAAKADGYYGVIKTLEMEAAAATAEAEQYQAKAAARTNAAKRLKDRMKLYLELTGRKELISATGRKFAIQANGGKVPLKVNETVCPEELPPQFQRVRVEVDTDAVRAAIEAGVKVEFAKLEPRGCHLRIR